VTNETRRPGTVDDGPALGPDFLDRLEGSLTQAEEERRRVAGMDRLRSLLPLGLLIGPIVAWRLLSVSSGSAHVVINLLAWLTFLLDVGVHVDTTVLTYLGLQAVPSIAGLLLLALVAATLLATRGDEA